MLVIEIIVLSAILISAGLILIKINNWQNKKRQERAVAMTKLRIALESGTKDKLKTSLIMDRKYFDKSMIKEIENRITELEEYSVGPDEQFSNLKNSK